MKCYTCQHGSKHDMYGDEDYRHCYFLAGERELGESRRNYLERARVMAKEECKYYQYRVGVAE